MNFKRPSTRPRERSMYAGAGGRRWTCAPTSGVVPVSITETPAYCYEEASPNSFLFSPLGIDTPLFTRPQPTTGIPGALNLPTPITRRSLTNAIARLLRRG